MAKLGRPPKWTDDLQPSRPNIHPRIFSRIEARADGHGLTFSEELELILSQLEAGGDPLARAISLEAERQATDKEFRKAVMEKAAMQRELESLRTFKARWGKYLKHLPPKARDAVLAQMNRQFEADRRASESIGQEALV